MGKRDIYGATIIGTIQLLVNFASIITILGIPFGTLSLGKSLLYIATMCASCSGALVSSTIFSSIGLAEPMMSLLSFIFICLAVPCRIFVVIVYGIAWGACERNSMCDAGLNWEDSTQPGNYVYNGPRPRFIVYFIMNIVLIVIELVAAVYTWSATATLRLYQEKRGAHPLARIIEDDLDADSDRGVAAAYIGAGVGDARTKRTSSAKKAVPMRFPERLMTPTAPSVVYRGEAKDQRHQQEPKKLPREAVASLVGDSSDSDGDGVARD